VDEDAVTPRRLDSLHDTVPALVATPGANRHDKPALLPTRRGLHLHAFYSVTEVGDQIDVWVCKQRHGNVRARGEQPGDGRQFAGITLPPRCPRQFHASIIGSAPDRKALEIPTILLQIRTGAE
jgi:hypothetical protein